VGTFISAAAGGVLTEANVQEEQGALEAGGPCLRALIRFFDPRQLPDGSGSSKPPSFRLSRSHWNR
jgi:hypothetical protein